MLLEIASDPKDAKTKRRVEIVAASRDADFATDVRAVGASGTPTRSRRRAAGRSGYIHIPSMDEAGLDAFVRALYSDNFDKEAIVIDVRYNGGGFTHDQVLNYLAGKEHTLFRQRDGGEGLGAAELPTASGRSRWW